MQQAEDFRDESRALQALLQHCEVDDLARVTQFKDWTVQDVIGHLHFWNRAARLSLVDPDAFTGLFTPLAAHLQSGGGLKSWERQALADLDAQALLDAWVDEFEATADAFARADPSQRVVWAGPSMSARSSVSARQMETWAHGQEVFDILGAVRTETDRLRNIVVLGINTFGWAFAVRGEQPPEVMPEVVLTAPSGDIWSFGDSQADSRITGSAVEFAQVVTQTRNVADTDLDVQGDAGVAWMQCAQCFAGAANPPPSPGSRFRVVADPSG